MITTFLRPETPAEAVVARRDRPGAVYFAGGTDVVAPWGPDADCAVSLERLKLRGIEEGAAGLSLGALTTLEDLARHSFAAAPYAAVARAARHVNNRHIRNAGTLGGNLASAKSSGDLAPVLLALGATCRVLGDDLAERDLPLADFLAAPAKPLLLAVRLPAPAPGLAATCRTLKRTANDVALVNAALAAVVEKGRIVRAVAAAGCVAPRPVVVPALGECLAGLPPADPAALEPALRRAAGEAVHPIDDHRASGWYRREALVALLLECLDELAERGRQR